MSRLHLQVEGCYCYILNKFYAVPKVIWYCDKSCVNNCKNCHYDVT